MNRFAKLTCLVACLLSAVAASPSHSNLWNKSSSMENGTPTWNTMRSTPWSMDSPLNMNEITLEALKNMPVKQAVRLIHQLHHAVWMRNDIEPTFIPSATNIRTTIVQTRNEKTVPLNNLASTVRQDPEFRDNTEVTMVITGLPRKSTIVANALDELKHAYRTRYTMRTQNSDSSTSSSEEQDGILVMIELGDNLQSFERYVKFDVEKTGAMIGSVIAQVSNEIPFENIHLIGQGIGAAVAGAVGRQFTRETGQKLRRITGLDPTMVLTRRMNALTGLARGDADFVDIIHTSANGMGITSRTGDVDFYPNGPSETQPGVNDIVTATMTATRYFAETVIPGNERNMLASEVSSLQDLKNNNQNGRRIPMGINTPVDARGDYMLIVNPTRPWSNSASTMVHQHHQHNSMN